MKKILRLGTFIAILSAIMVSTASPVHADVIRGYDAQIAIQKGGTILVKEKVDYDFGYEYKHGIFRVLPPIKKNTEGKEFEMTYKIQGITDGQGIPYHYSTSWVNNKLNIKIGDANRTITGVHTYVISYLVSGALTYFSDHDELYWNATGTDWPTSLENINASVRFPEGLNTSEIKALCYTGVVGSSTEDCQIVSEQGSISASTSSLAQGSGLTIIVRFPKGNVAVLEPKPFTPFENTWYGKVILGFIFLVLGILSLIWYVILPIYIPIKWYLTGRDPKSQDVRVWFDPPQTKNGRKITPAEAGALIDETVDTRDIFGSLIQLAERGYLVIQEKKKGEFTLIEKSPQDGNLLPFEKKLLKALFKDGGEIAVKDAKIAEDLLEVSKLLYTQVVDEGYFPESPDSIRTRYYILAGVAMFTGNFVLAVIAFIFGRNMPRKTEFGAQQASIARSLKTFLTSQERQLAFQANNQMMFEKLLPYAIAFGVEKIWAARFKDMALVNPSWYTGYGNSMFNAVYFANSMHSSVSSFTSAVTPTHSSSGFSSGFSGGFSGGGGGGGGGGSW